MPSLSQEQILLREARDELALSREAAKELIPLAAELGHSREPVDQRIASLDRLIGRIDAVLILAEGPKSAADEIVRLLKLAEAK